MKRYSAYPEYKPSGIDWLGDIPKHWEIKKLKYTSLINAETLTENTPADFEFNYIDIGNVDRVDGIVHREWLAFEDAPSRARRKVQTGDTIISTVRTYLRAIAYISESDSESIVSTGFAVIHPLDIECRFLSYYIQNSFFIENIVALSTGVSYPAINSGEIGNIPVLLPLPEEQQAIAAFLDRETAKIDGVIGKREKLIELLQEKRSALISHAVTKGLDPEVKLKPSGIDWLGDIPEHWEIKKLKHLGQAIIGLTYSPEDDVVDESLEDEKYLVLRSSNIQEGKLDYNDAVYVRKCIPNTLKVRENDILICARNGSRSLVGKNVIIKHPLPYTTFGAFMTIYRSPFNRFLAYAFNSSQFKSQTTIFLTTTINQLTNHDLDEVICSVPPLSEQLAIADYLDKETAKIDSLIEKEQTIIGKLKEYRLALISEAVTGKIDIGEGNA